MSLVKLSDTVAVDSDSIMIMEADQDLDMITVTLINGNVYDVDRRYDQSLRNFFNDLLKACQE